PQARPEQIRRLQIHAQSCDAPVFLFRPVAALSEASPAPLRIAVVPTQGWLLEVRIPKRRGASFDDALHLAAMPGNLEGVIPPRLQSVPTPAAVPSNPETSDAWALGRIAPPSTADMHAPH
ncbi:MAG: recombinase RecA, partial [Burkholderiaceae bacterium]|nr:recombinase RecA [Burkholderiaceae bacterium]